MCAAFQWRARTTTSLKIIHLLKFYSIIRSRPSRFAAVPNVKRWLFNIVAAISLVLFIGAVVFGIRGYWTQDLPQVWIARYPHPNACELRWLGVRSASGRLEISVGRNDFLDLALYGKNRDVDWRQRFGQETPQGISWQYSSRTRSGTCQFRRGC